MSTQKKGDCSSNPLIFHRRILTYVICPLKISFEGEKLSKLQT